MAKKCMTCGDELREDEDGGICNDCLDGKKKKKQ